MLQNQINFVKIIIQFLQFLKTLEVKTLQTPSTLFIWVIFGQFLVSKKQLLLSKRLVSCCTQMLKNCDFLVNLNLCCVLVSSCFATFLKNKFFGCFIAIINRFLLVRSEKIFSTFVCEFTMFNQQFAVILLRPLWPLQRLFASHIQQRARLSMGSLLNAPHICWHTWNFYKVNDILWGRMCLLTILRKIWFYQTSW